MAFTGRASDFKQLDYGNAVQTGQKIKYNRMRNQALGQDLQERQDLIKKRNEAAQIRQQLKSMPAAIDEMENRGLYDQAAKLRDNYVKQMKSGYDIAKMMAEGLDETNYQQTRQDLIQSGAITGDMWPKEYSEDWWAKTVASTKSELEVNTLRWTNEDGIVMSTDYLDRDGRIIEEGTYEASGDRKARTGDGDSQWTYKASDDSAMGHQAERMFSTTYHPETGKFSGLSEAKALEVQAVHSAATEIFKVARGEITHAQAIREAAHRLRIPIEDPEDTRSTDPAGIRVPGLPDGMPAPQQ